MEDGIAQHQILVATHIAISTVRLVFWAWLVGRASSILATRWRVTLDRLAGAVLILLGVRLATSSRY